MRIFLTGGTGYIGSSVLEALNRAGHHVTALVRDSNRGRQVAAAGASPVVGDLGEPATWRDAASGHDAWIHTAYEQSDRGPATDRAALETILTAAGARAAEPPALVVYTSAIWVLGPAPSPIDESAPVNPIPRVAWRAAHERLVLDAASPTIRTAVVRPGVVYGGSRGLVSDLFKDGANSLIRVVGDASYRWPLVYNRDLADLYARIVATPSASGVFHATDDGDVRLSEVVEAIGRAMKTQPSVRHIPLDEARAKMGNYADALTLDQVVRSARARSIGWTPSLRSLIGNVPRLFEEWRADREI
jgi:nucleoside-diphosphate-sugar epimerase